MKLAVGIVAALVVALTGFAPDRAVAQTFEPLPAVDLAKLRPADFTDDELDVPEGGNNATHDMPYLLAHFKQVADAVSDGSGQWPRGFIGIHVWRSPKDNLPRNMRIMENNVALAFFYVTDRPWNVYRGHPALRQRLEAAFEFMLREQGPQGQFSEYEAKKWGLAPTGFATKFLGHTLELLKRPGAPQIDPKLLERVVEMQRKAILFVLQDPGFYAHGSRFTNQFGNVWSGGLAYAGLFPNDVELRDTLFAKHASSEHDFFSPVGHPYENDGPDWSYNLGTHASNQRMARHYTRARSNDALRAMDARLVDEERRFWEWVAYNAVPAGPAATDGFVLNRPIETRGNVGFTELRESNFGDEIELVRAFAPTGDEVAARRKAARAAAEKSWPKVAPLPIGDFRAYAPYDFLHREHVADATHPTAAQRDAARAKLPYFASDSFNHQRVDNRREPAPAYTFVRRPSYYAVFNSGNQRNEQRLGLGLLWNSKLGPFLQSQTGSTAHAWGTLASDVAADPAAAPRPAKDATETNGDNRAAKDAAGKDAGAASTKPYEAGNVAARFSVAGRAVELQPGVRDLPDGDVVVTYDLGGGGGNKELRFLADRIEVRVDHPGAFREQIPLLLMPGDELSTHAGVSLRRAGGTLRIEPTGATRVETVNGESRIGPCHVTSVHLYARDRLTYTVRIEAKP